MITRTEVVWRHLVVEAFDRSNRRSSISALSDSLGLPSSTIHKALERPRSIGAVIGSWTGLRIVDPFRLLQLWAGNRNLAKDIVYSTRVPGFVADIEDRLPSQSIPTAFTAYVRLEQQNLVADYDQVIAYSDPSPVRRRFARRGGQPNLVVLEPDPWLAQYGPVAPMCQVYVDLFNLPSWQAQRFLAHIHGRWAFTDAG